MIKYVKINKFTLNYYYYYYYHFGHLEKLFFNQSVLCAMYSVWWINFSPSSTDAEGKQKEVAITTISLVLAGGLQGKIREWNSQLGPSFFTEG